MKGLMKKDLLMLKNNARYFLIYILFYSLISLNESEVSSSISFILPFITIVMMISTFSYDEFNRWYSYAVAIPNGRKNIVKSKYVISAIVIILTSILSIGLTIIISSLKKNFAYNDLFSSCIGSIFACILMISIIYPFLFKYGTEKGRLAMVALSFIIIGGLAIISKMPKFKISIESLVFLTEYGTVILIILSIALITISYLISKKIFSKKEF